ncbi:PAS domain-containing protein [Polyangium spumosum]|uniref:histidine kinase n=2 Tax=Polyangium spumosum TaxID=889282 RepID=A0A6N7Q3C9_9BACT|nr:PAS domain-containing protein [Polyangium spumosum]
MAAMMRSAPRDREARHEHAPAGGARAEERYSPPEEAPPEPAMSSAERLRTLIEASPDPIFMKDGEGRWLEVNRAGLELFGLEGVDYQGKSEAELSAFTPFYRQALLFCPDTDRVAWDAGKLSRVEESVPRPDGSVRTYDVYKVPLFYPDGRRKGLVALGRDITDRRRAEEERDKLLEKEQAARAAAERAERRSAFLAETTRILSGTLDYEDTATRLAHLCVPFAADWCAVWTVDGHGGVHLGALAHVDPAREALAAPGSIRVEPDLPGGVSHVVRFGQPLLCPSVADTPEARLAALGTRDPSCEELVRTLGLSSYVAVPLVARGRTLGAITLARMPGSPSACAADLTLAEDLGHHAALALANARLYEESQEAIRARDEFLSIASHELRTPCTSLRLGIEALLRHARAGKLDRMPAPLIERLLETSDRQSKHLLHLIDRLLDVSRLEAGHLDLELEEVDLAALTREAAGELREESARMGGTLLVEAERPVRGMWDRARLRQVVTNLLGNALKYGAGKPVRVRASGDESQAWLCVEDRGIGIPEDRQPHIFERFERAVSSRHYGGLGLGLYIVRQIVEAHGGTIALASHPGEGSTFTVTLPKARAAVTARAS